MHPRVLLAVYRDARAVDFRQPVDVEELYAERLVDALAYLVAPALGAEDSALEVNLVAHSALVHLFGDDERVGRRAAEHRRVEVAHELKLAVGVARAGRYDHRAEALRSGLEAEASGPEAEARRYLHAVLGRDACELVTAFEHDGPVLDVLRAVGHDDGRPGRPRRRVDADYFIVRHALHAHRVGVAEVLLRREGQRLELLLRHHRVDRYILELLAVHRTLFGDAAHLRETLAHYRKFVHRYSPCLVLAKSCLFS